MDLKSTLNICHTCLSSDRQLYPLTTFPSILKLNFLLTNQTASVCWECKNSIIKFCKFIRKALTAQKMMVQARHNNEIVCLSTLAISKKQPLLEYAHLDDPLTHDIDEIKYIKEENLNSDTESETEFRYNEDSVQIDNNNDEFKNKSDNTLSSEENGENELESEKLDIKVEIESDEDKEEVAGEENFKSLSNINDKLLNAPEEIRKYILIVELTDEEVQKQRQKKRRDRSFTKWSYKCDYCIIAFKKEKNFNEHVKKYHSQMEHDYMNIPGDGCCCNICKVRLKSPTLAQEHRERHYIQYKCRLCMYETCYEWAILAHIPNKHYVKVVEQKECDPRSLISSTPIDNPENLETEYRWTCEICGYKMQRKDSLQTHIKRIHNIFSDKFACDNCPKTFTIKSQLEFHMISHDAGIAKQLLYCKICNAKFKSIISYKQHMKTAVNHLKKLFPCSECNKEFASEIYLKKHYKFFHLGKSDHQCDECKKMFVTKGLLTRHQQVHHGLNRPRKHVCNICGKKFYSASMLKRHQLIHSEQRSYMCSECGDTFKQPSALYLHTKFVHKKAKKLFKKQKNINI